jgi:hypothetical protein
MLSRPTGAASRARSAARAMVSIDHLRGLFGQASLARHPFPIAPRLTDADRQVRSPRHDAPAHFETQSVQLAGADIGTESQLASQRAEEFGSLLERDRGG